MTAASGAAPRTPAAPWDAVAAPGADPHRVARTVGWLATRGRSADALRRACLALPGTLGAGADDPAAPEVLDQVLDDGLAGVPWRSRADRVARRWAALGVRVATAVDPSYPGRLRAAWPHRDVPPLLAWRGAPPDAEVAAAVVGARHATAYGTGVAGWLAGAAAAAGVRVVSGGALGVDAAAHEAACEGPGGTTVVLGCGHAVGYPRPHAEPGGLFDRIVEAGGTLLSEQLPDARPHAGNVRARNRIVAALCDAVVVVEGGARSGALVTASAAAEHDVPVLAVPGDVRAPGSIAPHRLLTEGAAPCTSPRDLLDALGRATTATDVAGAAEGPRVASSSPSTPSVLPADVRAVLVAAWPRAVRVEDLAAGCGRPVGALLGALTRARVAGELAEDAHGVRLRRAP